MSEQATEVTSADQNCAKSNREYFEQGCLCISEGKIKKLSSSTQDWDAVSYYGKACKCSRNYIESN